MEFGKPTIVMKGEKATGQENFLQGKKQSDGSVKVLKPQALKPQALRKKAAFKPFADAESTIYRAANVAKRRSIESATQTEPPTPITAEFGAQTDAAQQPDSADELKWLTDEESPQSVEYLAKLADARRLALEESLEENVKLAEENRQLTDLVAAMISDADAAAAAIAASADACPHCGGRGTLTKPE